MSEMHPRHPGFTYSACGPFTINTKECKKLKKQEIHNIFIKKKLNKVCFQHDMTYGNFKYLTRKTAPDKIFHNKELNIAKSPKYDGY